HVPGWARYVVAPPRRDLASDEAVLHLRRFQAAFPQWLEESGQAWEAAHAADLVSGIAPDAGSVGGPSLPAYRACLARSALPPDSQTPAPARPPSQLLPQLEAVQQRDFFSGRDDGPPALPLLAVRAARRAVAANPQDAEGYVWLEQAYAVLHGNTRERAW